MVEIQAGSKQQPIILIPRINGVVVTVSEIKSTFSNFYISDLLTPIDWQMEHRTRTGTKTLIQFDDASSSDSQIYFFPDDTFYASAQKYTVLFYWTIGDEQVYTDSPITIDVKELHNEP